MKLKICNRPSLKKSDTRIIRQKGEIPAVIYKREHANEAVAVNAAEFSSLLRTVISGRLSTTIFTLHDEHGKERRAILKEIQYEPTTYNVRHLDFEELLDNTKISIKVPIECVGVADCVGIKLGGVLRQVLRHIRVRCLPKDIPNVFQIDVKNLALYETKRLSDLELPETVKAITDLTEVAVVIAKR